MASKTVIGFTGAFGSGCSSGAKHLRDEKSYTYVSLSAALRSELMSRSGGAYGAPARPELQRFGDELRDERGPAALVELSLPSIAPDAERVVVDSIRNTGEIDALRDAFGNAFVLIGVLASQEERWDRISAAQYTDKGLTQADFLEDDARDRDEETPHGQQVALCIDEADMLVDSGERTISEFYEKVDHLADLAAGVERRYAEPSEIFMHMAHSASHSSKCLKRHVGAVLVNGRGDVVGVGYNENPVGTHPCVEEPAYGGQCYRDIVRNDTFSGLVAEGARCPACGEPLRVEPGPPWRCSNCGEAGVKTNLEKYFFPDRAMSWCTAIHAEVRALLAAGEAARDAKLYTTTFPCMQCSEKVIQVGISEIWFTEAYPDLDGARRLRLAGIPFHQFEGVRSSAFERMFSTMKPK